MMEINSRAYCKTHHVGKKVEFELEKYQKFNLTVPLTMYLISLTICLQYALEKKIFKFNLTVPLIMLWQKVTNKKNLDVNIWRMTF